VIGEEILAGFSDFSLLPENHVKIAPRVGAGVADSCLKQESEESPGFQKTRLAG